jgi:hypothetical protein
MSLKRIGLTLAVLAALAACTIYNVGTATSGDGEGRQQPYYTIQNACANGTPNGQGCMDDYSCCSAHCCFGCALVTSPGQGICVECLSNFDCHDLAFPSCDLSLNRCVASGTGPVCVSMGGSCAVNPCCSGLNCDSSQVCNKQVADSGGGG